MITYETSETIQGEPADVFPYISRVDRYADWMNVQSAETATPDIRGRGQRWRAKTREGMFLIENSDFEENRLVGYRTIEGPFDWSGGFRLEAAGSGMTRITSFGQIKLSGFKRILEPLMANQVRRGEAVELKTLKGLIEGSQTSA